MSARDALFWDIWDNRTAEEKNALIDAFAHELAEKVRSRAWGLRQAFRDDLATEVARAADLIDPEAAKP